MNDFLVRTGFECFECSTSAFNGLRRSIGRKAYFGTGFPISGIDKAEATGATVFHAGTRLGAQGVETAGGRVLGVTDSGAGLAEAIEKANAAVGLIHFDRVHYRRDIGAKGLKRYNKNVGMGT